MGSVLAPSPELHSTPSTLLPAPAYISLYTCIYTRTHARTKRGPCNFHVEQGEGGEGKKDGRRGACREREGTQMPRTQQSEPNEAKRQTAPPNFLNLRGGGRHPMKL